MQQSTKVYYFEKKCADNNFLHRRARTHNFKYNQGSYRSSIVKFPDFSSLGMTISLTLSKQ